MKELIKRVNWKNVALFMLFFGLATLVWYEHTMQSVHTARIPVRIEYNKPGAVGLGEEGLPDTIMIEVRDNGTNLDVYYREPLHLTIDLLPYIHDKEGVIQISANTLRSNIISLLQGTSRLLSTTPEEISCTYFVEQEKEVPIFFDKEISTAVSYQLVEEPTLSLNKVHLYGKAEDLDAIDTIRTERLVLPDLDSSFTKQVPLIIPPGIRAEFNSVSTRIVTEQFTQKTITLPIQVTDVPDSISIKLHDHTTVEINARVWLSQYGNVRDSQFKVICKYDTTNRDNTLAIDVDYSANPHILDAWWYPQEVKYDIDEQ